MSYEPTKTAYTREELIDLIAAWMLAEFGNPRELEPEQRDQWYRDNGLIAAFIRDTHQP
jgi:hypothetical protein